MYESALKKLSPQKFEWFAQDVLFHLGFNIVVGPSEGVDDGMDMVAQKDGIKYLVSCKHNIISKRSVGIDARRIPYEGEIPDRMLQHGCEGFIPFYSTWPSSGLKRRLESYKAKGINVIEIYQDNIYDIIPIMMGFVLQKYFPHPHELHHNLNVDEIEYKPLICMNAECNKDLLTKENIHLSMASLVIIENELHLLFGCKHCINMYDDRYWAELTQIRYIEQLMGWRCCIDELLADNELIPSEDFYRNWSALQEAIIQILIPQGWGKWLA